MNMDFDDFIIVDYQQGISQIVEVVTEFIIIKVFYIGWSCLESHHDFCTVAVSDVFRCHMASYRLMMLSIDHLRHGRRCRHKVLRRNIFACKSRQEAFVDKDQSLTARIHNTDFFQNRQHIRCLSQSSLSSFKSCLHNFYSVISDFSFLLGTNRCTAGNSQNCSLNRLHNCLVSHFYTRLKGQC